MADVMMTYASLEAAAGSVNSAKADLEDVIAYLDSAVAALDGNWSGASYEAFRSAWQESKPTMQRLAEAVGNFAPELNRAVAGQQERESLTAASMGKLAF